MFMILGFMMINEPVSNVIAKKVVFAVFESIRIFPYGILRLEFCDLISDS